MTNRDVINYILNTPHNTNPAILLQHLETQDEEIKHGVDLSKYVRTVNNIGPDKQGNVKISIPDPVDLTDYATETYVDNKFSSIKVEDTAMTIVSSHNVANDAHNDIRLKLTSIDNRLTAFFNSDEATLDELAEIVAYITANKSLIESVTTTKVNIDDIVNNLVTDSDKHPLSASQGVALKSLIDSLDSEIDGKVSLDELTRTVNEALLLAKNSGEFTGPQGEVGPQGEAGPQGERGEKGEKGDKGEIGPQGEAGPQGPAGLTGPQGPIGPQGEKGEKGETGPQGEKGEKGDTGAQGPQGERGERGETGPQGEKGDKGEQGPIGPTGPQGEKGADGTGVTILGTFESYDQLIAAKPSGAAGDSYLVAGHLYVWSEINNNWEDVGNIQGPAGPQGVAGPQGEKGEKGDKGDQGPVGPEGAQGVAGPQGEKGEKGDKGDQGLTGATGPQGPIGPQGEKGEKGDTGAEGKTPIKGVDYFTDADKAEITPNFTFSINMISAYDQPSVTVEGTYPNLTYIFNIPMGNVSADPDPDPEVGEPKMWIGYLPYDPDGIVGVDSIDVIGAGLTKKYIDGAVSGGTLKEVPIATMSKTSIGVVPESAYSCCIYPADRNFVVTIDDGIGGKEKFSDKHGEYAVNDILLNAKIDGVQYKVSGFLSSMEGERFFYVD